MRKIIAGVTVVLSITVLGTTYGHSPLENDRQYQFVEKSNERVPSSELAEANDPTPSPPGEANVLV
jgi:hypothetical protein